MSIGPMLAESPDFWGTRADDRHHRRGPDRALHRRSTDDRFSPAPAFCCYAAVFFWWIATGLDNFVPGGKGPHTAEAVVAAITDTPLAAGTGAFGGLLSMSWIAVIVSVFFSLVCRCPARRAVGPAGGGVREGRRAPGPYRAEGRDQRVTDSG